MSISVLIRTLNEEENLPACLESLKWCDDIVVLDSFSTDRTVEIALAAGARVYQRHYDHEAGQRTYGLKNIEYKYPWVYMPDADEITPDDLRDEMMAIANDPNREEVLFKVRYKNMFMGRWIRHSSLYPTWITRFVRPDKAYFEREIHAYGVCDGPTGELKSHFIHYSFNKGLRAWYDKHNSYSSYEADISDRLLAEKINWSGIWNTDPVIRRRTLKEISYRLPFRPALRFIYMYFVRGGFLDGWPGYVYCRMLAAYEFMIVVKIAERRRRANGLPV